MTKQHNSRTNKSCELFTDQSQFNTKQHKPDTILNRAENPNKINNHKHFWKYLNGNIAININTAININIDIDINIAIDINIVIDINIANGIKQ